VTVSSILESAGEELLIPATGNERILWFALIVLVLSYLAGAWLNRRRGKAIGLWLQAGLAALGGKPAWKVTRSLSTGAEVTVYDAARPFRQVQASYFLMTREIMPLWGVELLRGKRDLLAIRADLGVQPVAEYELVPLQGKLRTLLDEKAGEQPWQWQEMPAGLGLATRGESSRATVQAIASFAKRHGPYIERLSLRPRQPHLKVFVKLAGLETAPAAEFLRAVKSVAGA
jgi:hypothetical protein